MQSISQSEPSTVSPHVPLSVSVASGLIIYRTFAREDDCSASHRPLLVATNDDLGAAVFFRPTCKMWGCPFCAATNQRRWALTAAEGTKKLLAAGHHVDFLTITSHERLRGAASFKVLPVAWRVLAMRYRRAVPAGDPKAFLAVPERHKDGSLHAHLIITGGLPKRWWKDNARECGLGYMADVQEVKSLGVSGYVSKYLTKTIVDGWPAGKRRINTSRSFPRLVPENLHPGWTFRKVPPERELKAIYGDFQALGYETFRDDGAAAWALLTALESDQMLQFSNQTETDL